MVVTSAGVTGPALFPMERRSQVNTVEISTSDKVAAWPGMKGVAVGKGWPFTLTGPAMP